MAARRQLPDIMGEALGRLRLANAEAPANVVPLAISLAEPCPNLEEKLVRLRLTGMAQALHEQDAAAQADPPGFEQRLGHLLDRELDKRRQGRQARALKKAQLRYEPDLAEVECSAARGIGRELLEDLARGGWLDEGRNLFITGEVGSGKTFVACALAKALCLGGYAALYRRVSQLAAELGTARAKGGLGRLMATLRDLDLLLLDDWGLERLDKRQALDVFEVIEARHQRKSHLVVSSRMPQSLETWPQATADPVLAQAMADRLRQGSMAINLQGGSRRAPGDGRDSGWSIPITIS